MYKTEGNNLAVTKDNKHATILSDTEFVQCTLAQGHFCSLNTALHHIASNTTCLTAIFLRDNDKINKQCKSAITNITDPQANYLDQGNWAISVKEPTQMEMKCTDHTHVKTLQPPITSLNLQSACSALLPKIKLPPYLKQYSKGFHVAFRMQTFICLNSPYQF